MNRKPFYLSGIVLFVWGLFFTGKDLVNNNIFSEGSGVIVLGTIFLVISSFLIFRIQLPKIQ